MVGVGNQASSPSSKNTLRTICTSSSTKVELFLLVPGHPGTTPSYAPGHGELFIASWIAEYYYM